MSGFAWGIVIEREADRPPLMVGPFRSRDAAEAKADTIIRGLERIDLDAVDRPVWVVPMDSGSTAAREIVETAQ